MVGFAAVESAADDAWRFVRRMMNNDRSDGNSRPELPLPAQGRAASAVIHSWHHPPGRRASFWSSWLENTPNLGFEPVLPP